MAEYLPHRTEGPITTTASAAVTAGQLLAVTGSGTMGPAGAASNAWIGVAMYDAPSGGKVSVSIEGVQLLTASATIAAGDSVVAAAAGQIVTAATPASDVFVGKALTGGTVGQLVQVRVNR
jgi:predicted RecA/RadA family phage recombinase